MLKQSQLESSQLWKDLEKVQINIMDLQRALDEALESNDVDDSAYTGKPKRQLLMMSGQACTNLPLCLTFGCQRMSNSTSRSVQKTSLIILVTSTYAMKTMSLKVWGCWLNCTQLSLRIRHHLLWWLISLSGTWYVSETTLWSQYLKSNSFE